MRRLRAGRHLSRDEANASDWSEEITLAQEESPHIAAYFNRGIVAAQWVSRRLNIADADFEKAAAKKLTEVIDTPGDALRNYLTGPLGARLFELLEDAAADGRHIYAALYELNDPLSWNPRWRNSGNTRMWCWPTAASNTLARTRTNRPETCYATRSTCTTGWCRRMRWATTSSWSSATTATSRAGCGPAARTGATPGCAPRPTIRCSSMTPHSRPSTADSGTR